MSGVFVDTSALYALYSFSDGVHAEAVVILRQLRRERASLVTTDIVLLESYVLVHARGGLSSLLEYRAALVQTSWLQIVPTSSEHHAEAWNLLERRRDKGYSFVDAVSFVLMRTLGVKRAFAFDVHFEQEGFEIEVGRRRDG